MNGLINTIDKMKIAKIAKIIVDAILVLVIITALSYIIHSVYIPIIIELEKNQFWHVWLISFLFCINWILWHLIFKFIFWAIKKINPWTKWKLHTRLTEEVNPFGFKEKCVNQVWVRYNKRTGAKQYKSANT